MRGKILAAGLIVLALSGCVVGPPAPYYGGYPPYYGTTYVPGYVGVGVYGGGYYPYYGSRHIHSGYNNAYWHSQRAAAGRPAGNHPH